MLFITGATGHSGRWFIRKLEDEEYAGKIRCLVREESDVVHLKQSPLKIELCYGDMHETSVLEQALDGVKEVVHIANIKASEKIVEVGMAKGVKRFILVHTTGRFSAFKSASAEYIRIEDGLIEKYRNLTILRPTMIYGGHRDANMWKLVRFLDRNKFFPVFGNGKNLMHPVYARDLAEAYYACLVKPDITTDKQYDLSGGKELTYGEILSTVSRLLGKKTIFVKMPIPFCKFAVKLLNILTFGKAPVREEQVLRMQEDKVFPHDDAAKDFGYAPLTFEQGIARAIEEYRTGNYSI